MLIAPEVKKNVLELVKHFLVEQLEKTVTSNPEVVCLPPHDDFISGIFKHPGFFKCGC